MTYTYSAYNLNWLLPFPCPVLPLSPADASPDVTVTYGSVPRQLTAPVAEGLTWQAEPNRFLMKGGQRSGRFLVEGGQSITVERNPAAEDKMLALHFLDAVLAAALRQRGLLVLHANSAITPMGAVAIAGESGAGKSTTLTALLQQGCTMLADDITVLHLTADRRIEVLPGVPELYLTEDSAEKLGADIAHLPRVRRGRMKAAVPIPIATESAPLRALYLLRTHPAADLRCEILTGIEKFSALQDCIYGPMLAEEHPDQFPLFMAITAQVKVVRLERPANRWSIAEVVELILSE